LNMSSSISSYLDLRPYSQNTVHEIFSRVLTVASVAILMPRHFKCSRNYSACFSKNVTGCTQEKYFSNTQGNRYFCTDATLRLEVGIRLRFWETGPRHIMKRQYITDIWSYRHFVFATFGHIDILSRRQINLCWCDEIWVCFATI
jgi:hypothetical protein